MSKITTEEWIKRAIKKHGYKYDYSHVKYIDAYTPVEIICPKHGTFLQVPYYHVHGNGCQECAKEKRKKAKRTKKTTQDFIKECKEKYGETYDYSKVEYVNAKTKVLIINNLTKEEKFITPTDFLEDGLNDKVGRLTTEKWIKRAKEKYGDKYDYSKTVYVHPKVKIKYVCPIHGEIEQLPHNHIKYGCRFCSYDKAGKERRRSFEDFIKQAKDIHLDKYSYDEKTYTTMHDKMRIICPKHGEFWQKPNKHLSGHGCPKCSFSHLEEEMLVFLEKNNIKYEIQYSPDFLKNGNGKQKLDFYLPLYNVAIECQGIQHFKECRYSNFKNVELNQKRDIIKFNKCKENNIKILYYTTKDNFKFINELWIYTENNTYYNINETLDKLNTITKNTLK